MRVRKKPVEVDAEWFARPNPNLSDDWLVFAVFGCRFAVETDDRGMFVMIPTLEGPMRANLGDFIIRGVRGELYPCKADIFLATYEGADASSSALLSTLNSC